MLTGFLIVVVVLLTVALVAIVVIWNKANQQLVRYDSIDDVESYKAKCAVEAERIQADSKKVADAIVKQRGLLARYTESVGAIRTTAEAKERLDEFNAECDRVRLEIGILEETSAMHEIGFYSRRFDFDHPDEFKRRISETVDQQKAMIKQGLACRCDMEWQVEGSVEKGRKMTNEQIKLMMRAFNGECDAAIAKVRHSNFESVEKRISKCFETLNKLGATKEIFINSAYLDLKLRELYLNHEHEIVRQEEKERQREIREQIREEQKAEREIAEARKKAEIEESIKENALKKARQQLVDEHGQHNERLSALIAKLERELKEATERKARAISRAQLTRSGHVYVISNIGTMGHGIYKIGMTRRLEPLDRVKELGDASVPFPFDVHAMIYGEDAPGLESALHKRFDSRRVNLINLRREYFRVSLDEIQAAVADLHGEFTFKPEPDAEQYRETVAIRRERVSESLSG